MESIDTLPGHSPADPSAVAAPVISFRESSWKTWTIWVSLGVLALWRALVLFSPSLHDMPGWLVLTVFIVGPQIFIVALPLLTRLPSNTRVLQLPPWRKLLTEFAIAVPVVFATLFTLGTINLLLNHFIPGKSLSPEEVTGMARTSSPVATILMLVYAFTLAPIAEEIFFRGYLQNALGARMPAWIATVVQCTVFGLIHTYAALPTIAVIGLGLVLTLVYQWRQTLLASTLVHAGINLTSSVTVMVMMFADANAPVLGIIAEPKEKRCVVQTVITGSPAERAGLRAGDVVTGAGGSNVDSFSQLVAVLANYQAGDRITIAAERDGVPIQLDVQLVARRSLPPK